MNISLIAYANCPGGGGGDDASSYTCRVKGTVLSEDYCKDGGSAGYHGIYNSLDEMKRAAAASGIVSYNACLRSGSTIYKYLCQKY